MISDGQLAPETQAEVAELADAHGSGPCTRKGVGVRVPSSAPNRLQVIENNVYVVVKDFIVSRRYGFVWLKRPNRLI